MKGVRKDDGFEVLSVDPRYRGQVVEVASEKFRLPTGVECEHDLVMLPDVVAIVPLRSTNDGQSANVVLIEQIRHALGGFMHEIPAGHIEEGETPLESAQRELREETGFDAERWTQLAVRLTIPGLSAQRMHYFLAEGLVPGVQSLEESECLELREYALEDLAREILSGTEDEPRVVDAKTHVGVLHAAALRLGGAFFERLGREGEEK